MYNMKNTLYLAALSALMFSAAGCRGNDAPEPESETTGVALLTRGEGETAGYRLLVFDGSSTGDGKCLLNRAFGSGNESVQLENGTYRFATLSGVEGFDLPAGGTTDGIDLSQPIPLKTGWQCTAARLGVLQEVDIPTASVYSVALQPATCLLKLKTADAPDGIVLSLENMYDGIPLSGNYAEDAHTAAYVLQSGPNICLPTAGNARLAYRSEEGDDTLDLDMQLDPGYTYQATLQWHNGRLGVTSRVEKWDGNTNVEGDAE